MAAVAALLAAGGLVAGGTVAVLRRGGGAAAQAAAGGLLLALVAGDLLPDAVGDSGLRAFAAFVIALVVGTARMPVGTDGCCAPPVGRLGALALIAHGVGEGALLGLGGELTGSGSWLALAFALHKAGEGFALAAGVADGERRLARVAGWLTLAGTAPVAGALLANAVPVSGTGLPLMTAAVAGLLAAVALRLVRPALAAHALGNRAMVLLGLVAMTAVIGLGG